MGLNVGEQHQVSHIMLLYLISSMQIGVGILSFETSLSSLVGADSWISILTAGILINIVFWMMYSMLKRSDGTIFSIHESLFGKYAGKLLSFLFICYAASFIIVILRSYIDIIETWIFPQLSTWVISLIFLLLCYYFVIGGFRTVTGICFLSVIYSIPLLDIKYFPLMHAHYTNLLPIMNHSPVDLLKATKEMSLSYMGFELIMIFYPFIKRPDHARKWGHFGLLLTIYVYFVTAIVSFVYFNEDMLRHTLWPTLTMWKIVSFPVFERFEYIGITMWLFVILPNLCLGIWCIARGLKDTFSFNQRTSLPFILTGLFIACILLKDHVTIEKFNVFVCNIGFYFLYIYIPLLFIWQWVNMKGWRQI